MANKKITELDLVTALTTDDYFVLVDDPAGTPVNKAITVANVFGGIDVATVIDFDGTEALLVRKDGDAGDVFMVDTTNSQVKVASGSAAAPSMSFIGDTDTGWYSSGANEMAFTSGGTQILMLDNNEIRPITTNNVALGATTKVYGSIFATTHYAGLGAVGTPSYTFNGDTDTGMYSPAANTLALATAGANRVYVTSAGRVGFAAVTAPATRLANTTTKTTGSLSDDALLWNISEAAVYAVGIKNGLGRGIHLEAASGNPSLVAEVGAILIGTTTTPTSGNKALMVGDNGGDPTPGTNTAGIYGKDVTGTVEMFAIDEAGNATQLSSHVSIAKAREAGVTLDDDDMMPRVEYSSNRFIGVEEYRYIHPKTGETQIVQKILPDDQLVDWEANQTRCYNEREHEREVWRREKSKAEELELPFDIPEPPELSMKPEPEFVTRGKEIRARLLGL